MQDESCKDEESADVKLFLVQAFFEAGVAVFQAQVFLFEVDDCRLEFAVALVDGDGVAGGTLQGDEFVARFFVRRLAGLQGELSAHPATGFGRWWCFAGFVLRLAVVGVVVVVRRSGCGRSGFP